MPWHQVLEPRVLVFMIPIVAILVGGAVLITKLMIRHRERLAMIERGIHPDAPHPDAPQHDPPQHDPPS